MLEKFLKAIGDRIASLANDKKSKKLAEQVERDEKMDRRFVSGRPETVKAVSKPRQHLDGNGQNGKPRAGRRCFRCN